MHEVLAVCPVHDRREIRRLSFLQLAHHSYLFTGTRAHQRATSRGFCSALTSRLPRALTEIGVSKHTQPKEG